jgi:hypothetical protein
VNNPSNSTDLLVLNLPTAERVPFSCENMLHLTKVVIVFFLASGNAASSAVQMSNRREPKC